MDPTTIFDSRYEFIELNRTFHELSKHNNENDDVDINQAFHSDEHLCWPNLIKEYRLIILSEAGSGKTTEIRNIARMLRGAGEACVFSSSGKYPQRFRGCL